MIAAVNAAAAVWWGCVVAVVWVLLYRAAFPRSWDEELAAGEAAAAPAAASFGALGQLVDSRPRTRCPACGEMILVEARRCRFCGYRFAPPAGNS